MPTYNVTFKEGATDDDYVKTKEEVKSKGGSIKHEFTLFKGFTVEFPEDQVDALTTNDKINVELDGEMRTQ